MTPLFQALSIIIIKPVSKSILKRPLEFVTAILQFRTTYISGNLKFLYTCRTYSHRRTHCTYYCGSRHDNPVRYIRNKLFQSRNFLHSLNNMLNSVSRFITAIIQFYSMLMVFKTIKHKTHKLLNIYTSLYCVFPARVSKLMSSYRPIQTGEVSVLPFSEYHTRTYYCQLPILHITILPFFVYLFGNQFRYAISSIRSGQCCFFLQLFSCTVWSY